MKVIAVIPAYNEAEKIFEVVSTTKELVDRVIVVNDASQDNTLSICQQFDNRVVALSHAVNLGQGAALKTGCEAAWMMGAEAVILIDGDNQHDPSEIPFFIEKLKQGYEVVFGVRRINNEMPFIKRFGNLFLTKATHKLFNVSLSDVQCGYRIFSQSGYKKLEWDSIGYPYAIEMVVNAGKNKVNYEELLTKTIYHDNYKGTTLFDGIKIFIKMLSWKINK
jgi:glycosyltransferase involved in cell wall biosynthesis